MIRSDVAIEECEESMACRFDGANVSGEPLHCITKPGASLGESPPSISDPRPARSISARLYARSDNVEQNGVPTRLLLRA